MVVKVYVPVAVPPVPVIVLVEVGALVMPEGVTVTLADGVPIPEAEVSLTVAVTVAPRATVEGALIVKIAASGWRVMFTVPFEEA